MDTQSPPNRSVGSVSNAPALAYSYIRFSTPEQLKGDSLHRQTERSQEYAQEHNLKIDDTLKLQDLGISAFKGKNSTEGALAGFFTAIQTGRVKPGSTLLVESLDRLSRNQITEALTQFLQIINAGITVVTLMDKMVYSTATINANPGSLMMSIVIMMRAHEESATKADRLARSWSAKRNKAIANKTPLTSRAPAWLKLTPDGFQVIPERATLIQRIFQMSAAGLGKRLIAKTLNGELEATWGDGIKSARKANGWHDSYILKILNNQAVIGHFQPHWINPDTRKREPKGEPIGNYFPAIISPEVWASAHRRPSAPTGPRSKKVNNLFSGLLYDGYTGERMLFTNKNTTGDTTRGCGKYLYSDITRLRPGTKGQTWPYEHFERVVTQFLCTLDWASLLNTQPDAEITSLRNQECQLSLEAENLQSNIDRLLDSFAGAVSPALAKSVTAKTNKLAAQLETTETALQSLRRQLEHQTESEKTVKEGLDEFRALISAGSPSERIKLQNEIRRRVKKITLWRHGHAAPFVGTTIEDNPMPCIGIEFHNGAKQWIFSTINKSGHYQRLQRDIKGRIIGINRTPDNTSST